MNLYNKNNENLENFFSRIQNGRVDIEGRTLSKDLYPLYAESNSGNAIYKNEALKSILQKTREGLAANFDQKDPEFITLKDELERLFKKKNLSEVSKEEMEKNIEALTAIHEKSKELERTNNLIKAKYENDAKYARIHKRLMEKDPLTDSERKLFEVLCELKEEVDNQILQNAKILENESFVDKMIARLVIGEFKKQNIPLDLDKSKRVINLVTKEYMNEYYGRTA